MERERLKIIHILNSVGGVDVSVRIILENIDSKRFESFVIHGTEDTSEPFKDDSGHPVKDYKISIQRNISFINDIKAIYSATKVVESLNPDLIHAHSAKGGIIAKLIARRLKIPVLHTPQAYSYLSAKNGLKRRLYLTLEKFFVHPTNKILASSKSEMKRAIDDVGYPVDKVLQFNNCIKPIKTEESLSFLKTWPEHYICSVGRPSYQKNIELMLDVLIKTKKSIPDIHLVLMGVGYHSPNLEYVKGKIKKLSLTENITLLEWTSREDIFNIIRYSMLYLTTARYEGLPYSVIESLALGKAIVATDVDGNKDLVINNFNGYLIKEGKKEALAEAVIEIYKDEILRERFSINSFKLFEENFDVTKNIKKLESIYMLEAKND